MTADRSQLRELAQPFPAELIERDPRNNAYVAHEAITQRLLRIVGPFDFCIVREIRGDVPAVDADPSGRSRRAKDGTPALTAAICGVVCQLTATVDGHPVTVEEVGEVDDLHNWAHDGMRLKVAVSDGLKRCAMRLGLGLHLWAQDRYFLADALELDAARAAGADPQTGEVVEPQPAKGNGQAKPARRKPPVAAEPLRGDTDPWRKRFDSLPNPAKVRLTRWADANLDDGWGWLWQHGSADAWNAAFTAANADEPSTPASAGPPSGAGVGSSTGGAS